jgi:hypothetical protein
VTFPKLRLVGDFPAALHHDGIAAPLVLGGPMSGEAFLAYVEQALVLELRPADVVIIYNLSAHKVAGVRQAIETLGPGQASNTSRPTVPTSIPSQWPSQNSNPCGAPPKRQ